MQRLVIGGVILQEIRIFKDTNEICLVEDVNDFIRNNKIKVQDIKYSTSGGVIFGTEYSVMIFFEK